MEENITNGNEEKENKLDGNTKDIIKKANAEKKLSDLEKKILIDQINNDFDFNSKIQILKEQYDLKMDKYVIFTNGKEQLYYENGEFFVISTIDSKAERKKIKRNEARDMYNEFYLVTVLNPLLKQKNTSENISKLNTKEKNEEKKDLDIKNENKPLVEKIKAKVKDIDQVIPNDEEKVKERLNKLKKKEKDIKKKREKEKQSQSKEIDDID